MAGFEVITEVKVQKIAGWTTLDRKV